MMYLPTFVHIQKEKNYILEYRLHTFIKHKNDL